ncbi:MAG TPA: DHH family phosphoesterase [Methanocorpusculum sp.]|nr:DHH family phosphoesterase [Methanocorpusculum sp.]
MEIVQDIEQAVERIRSAEKITVISHIDADGITSASIMLQAIQREGIPVVSVFVRQLEPLTMRHIPSDTSLKLFTDLGSGQQNLLEEAAIPPEQVLILDHHIAQDAPNGTKYFQVNAQFYGEDYRKCSAAGICYLVARNLNPKNYDLAKLAVVGNVGDMMARESGRLVGIAHWIVEDAEKNAVLVSRVGINCYGLSTRALHLSLSNCDDPVIPGISGNPQAAINLLCKIGIYADEHDNRTFEDLTDEEVKTLSSRITEQMIANGEDTDRLFSEQYFFPDEMEHTPLRNASEYATMLNACGRWAKPMVGAAVCAGERGVNYREAEHMLRHHRSIIRELCEYILETGVAEHSAIQSIHTGNRYPDTIVGIGAGMALSKLNRDKPILVLSEVSDEPDMIKVSMRTNEKVVRRGVNLQEALCSAAAEFGGAGGGHNIAAGAYIPKGCEDDFIRRVNELIETQLNPCTENC